MKVTVTLEVDEHVSISCSEKVLKSIMGTVRTCGEDVCDRTHELGLLNDRPD